MSDMPDMPEQETKKKKPPTLAYILERWQQELEPVLTKAMVEQEPELEALWERTLRWLKEERGLQGDSLRKPITQIRGLIKLLPMNAENTWTDPRSRKSEHVALHLFNLPEHEWERMNARAQLSLQERLEHQQFLEQATTVDAIVNRGLILVQSQDWAEVLVGLALGSGRRFWELVKTGTFVEAAPYVVLFRGQVKGQSREDEAFEIPTLYRAFLLVDAIGRLRQLIDWSDLEDEYSPKYQKYNKVANEMVVQQFSDLIPVRPTRERLNLHVLRSVFARIATYWYAPPEVADITFMAQIQGHRYILNPDVKPGETPEDIKNKQLNYAANANYFDYKIGRKTADGSYQPVGDQGVKLGHPGVTRLSAFPAAVPAEVLDEAKSKRKGKGKKQESASEWAPVTVRRHSREWYRELSLETKGSGSRQSEKDDAFLRRLLTMYVMSGQADAAVSSPPALSLDLLAMPEKTRDLYRQAMALSGATDLLSFLLAAAEPEAQRLMHQDVRHTALSYETLSTDALDTRDPGARQELYRRAVFSVMRYNQEHSLLERWYLSDRAIQSLAGGRKDFIKQYKDAHAEEIEAHHRELAIQEGFNRKPGKPQIQEIITIPNEATAFPWGRPSPLN
jgi:Telomere resolvase